MKSKQEIGEQWERIKTKHAYYLEQKKANLLSPKGHNKHRIERAHTMVLQEIDTEFVYTVYGSKLTGDIIRDEMDELKHKVHFEYAFEKLEEKVEKFLSHN